MQSNRIVDGLQEVEKLAYELGEKNLTLNKWTDFFYYYKKEWLQIVKPQNYIACGVRFQTNNFINRWHRDLNLAMGTKPSTRDYIGNEILFLLHLN